MEKSRDKLDNYMKGLDLGRSPVMKENHPERTRDEICSGSSSGAVSAGLVLFGRAGSIHFSRCIDVACGGILWQR